MLRRTLAVAASAVVALTACSSDDGDDAAPSTTEAQSTTTTEAAGPLDILVTNDDGIGAVGIDVLVQTLGQMDDVNVQVVAPAENQSGSSDTTTPGGAPYADGQTASGVAGTAVDGFPADTIAVALDELGLEPDVVVSGVNTGQNLGPLVYVSGTIGAGREAVRRGIPAIAGSAGLTEDSLDDYQLAADLIVAQIEENRADYAAGSYRTDAVASINVPDCTAGTARELVEVPVAAAIPAGVVPFATDCSAPETGSPSDDVLAMVAGHPSLSFVPPDQPTG